MPAVRRSPLRLMAVAIASTILLIGAGCRSDSSDSAPSTTTTDDEEPGTVTTTTPEGEISLLTTSDGFLILFTVEDPEGAQIIAVDAPADPADPTGTTHKVTMHDQPCFFADGSKRFLMPVDPVETVTTAPSWGLFQLSGDRVGSYKVDFLGSLGALSYAELPAGQTPHPYGCAALSDGRMVTTDLGDTTPGAANGQVTIWFPPIDGSTPATFCKIDVGIATPKGVWVDDQDRVHVASPAAPTAGVWRYSRLPTSADASGGCGAVDPLGSPLADQVRRQPFIAAGDHGLEAPAGIALSPTGELFVSSTLDGIINGYDVNGDYFGPVLTPSAGDRPSSAGSFEYGTPEGLAVDGEGTLYYADPQYLGSPGSQRTPAEQAGYIQLVGVADGGQAEAPKVLFEALNNPTNVTVISSGGGSSGSKL